MDRSRPEQDAAIYSAVQVVVGIVLMIVLKSRFEFFLLCSLVALLSYLLVSGQHIENIKNSANAVSVLRLFLLILIIFLYSQLGYELLITVYSIVFVCLDYLDGHLARSSNNTTLFGSLLDVESDSYFVFLLTFLLYTQGIVGLWLVSIGILRFVYVVLVWSLQMSYVPDSGGIVAKTIFVIMAISLGLTFYLPQIFIYTTISSSILVVISFCYSFYKVLQFNLYNEDNNGN